MPRTFSFACFRTSFLACSSESAEYSCSVLYWILPAQFISLSPNAQVSKGESTGVPISIEHSLRKARLSTGRIPLVRNSPYRGSADRCGCHRNVFIRAVIIKQQRSPSRDNTSIPTMTLDCECKFSNHFSAVTWTSLRAIQGRRGVFAQCWFT